MITSAMAPAPCSLPSRWQQGKVTAAHKTRRRRIEFLDFMNDIVAAHADTAIHVILDNLNTHKPRNASVFVGRPILYSDLWCDPSLARRLDQFRVPHRSSILRMIGGSRLAISPPGAWSHKSKRKRPG